MPNRYIWEIKRETRREGGGGHAAPEGECFIPPYLPYLSMVDETRREGGACSTRG